MAEAKEEKLPISEMYNVLEHITLLKSQKWWKEVVLFEYRGRRVVGMYLWVSRNGVWKRKHKFDVWNAEEWTKIKNAVDQLAPKLAPK
jgi:hypothetical protein